MRRLVTLGTSHADVIVPQLRGRDDFTLDLGAASFLATWDP